MRNTFKKAGVVCGTAFASAALALMSAMPASAESTAVIIGGIKAGTMSDMMMKPLLSGQFANETRVNVQWPAQAGPMTGKGDLTLGASINVGITNLTAQINTALANLDRDANGNVVNGEKVTVVGLSAGSLVVDEVMRNMMKSGQLTDPSIINFVLVEDSSRQKLIKDATYNKQFDYTYHLPPVTPYNVTVVTGEFDGMADLPDRPFNFLAIANAMAGSIVVHVPVMYYGDLSKVPAQNITTEVNASGGITTHYLIPTTTLPLVQLIPSLKPKEAELRAKIEKGYSRYDTQPAPEAVKASVAQAAVESTPVEGSGSTTAEGTGSSDTATQPSTPAGLSKKEQRAADRAAAAQARADAKTARQEARAQAKADRDAAKAQRAADREAAKEARKAAKAGGEQGSSSGGPGSSDSHGSSE